MQAVERRTFTVADAGCYLDNHRGHYITRDMIALAVEFGYIVDPITQWFLDSYEDHCHEDSYPAELIVEIADEAIAWLNIGENVGLGRPIPGQNNPPAIPDGYVWEFNDGDFGLYSIEEG